MRDTDTGAVQSRCRIRRASSIFVLRGKRDDRRRIKMANEIGLGVLIFITGAVVFGIPGMVIGAKSRNSRIAVMREHIAYLRSILPR